MLERSSQINILLIGPSQSGKKSFIAKACHDPKQRFHPPLSARTGGSKALLYQGSKKVNLIFTTKFPSDCNPAENEIIYCGLIREQFRKTHLALVLLDVTDPHALETASASLKIIYERGSFDKLPEKYRQGSIGWPREDFYEPPKIMLIATKIDSEVRVISTEDIQIFAKENNLNYIEVSAKNGSNIDEALGEICALHFDNTPEPAATPYNTNKNENIIINEKTPQQIPQNEINLNQKEKSKVYNKNEALLLSNVRLQLSKLNENQIAVSTIKNSENPGIQLKFNSKSGLYNYLLSQKDLEGTSDGLFEKNTSSTASIVFGGSKYYSILIPNNKIEKLNEVINNYVSNKIEKTASSKEKNVVKDNHPVTENKKVIQPSSNIKTYPEGQPMSHNRTKIDSEVSSEIVEASIKKIGELTSQNKEKPYDIKKESLGNQKGISLRFNPDSNLFFHLVNAYKKNIVYTNNIHKPSNDPNKVKVVLGAPRKSEFSSLYIPFNNMQDLDSFVSTIEAYVKKHPKQTPTQKKSSAASNNTIAHPQEYIKPTSTSEISTQEGLLVSFDDVINNDTKEKNLQILENSSQNYLNLLIPVEDEKPDEQEINATIEETINILKAEKKLIKASVRSDKEMILKLYEESSFISNLQNKIDNGDEHLTNDEEKSDSQISCAYDTPYDDATISPHQASNLIDIITENNINKNTANSNLYEIDLEHKEKTKVYEVNENKPITTVDLKPELENFDNEVSDDSSKLNSDIERIKKIRKNSSIQFLQELENQQQKVTKTKYGNNLRSEKLIAFKDLIVYVQANIDKYPSELITAWKRQNPSGYKDLIKHRQEGIKSIFNIFHNSSTENFIEKHLYITDTEREERLNNKGFKLSINRLFTPANNGVYAELVNKTRINFTRQGQ